MGAASGRGEQSYGVVTIALEKGHTDPKAGIRYDQYFLTTQQRKAHFNEFFGHARQQKLSLDSCIKTYFCALNRLS